MANAENNGWYKLASGGTGQQPAQGRSAPPRQAPAQPTPPRQPQQAQQSQQARQAQQPQRPPQPAAARPRQPGPPRENRPPASPGRRPGPPPGRPAPGGGKVVPYGNEAVRTLHTQTVGERGPAVVEDLLLHENLETFVHSKVPERAVHVKGFGAFGTFTTTHSMREYTTAGIFQSPGTQTQALTRFSLAVSTKGTPDTSRNVRGFSTKFYTPDGVFDLLCNHIPVFTVRDAMRFPESINSFLPDPRSNLADPERFWGFTAKAPESTLFITWLYSDVGTIKSLRKIRAYGVNTYVWRNAQGERRYVKYHWIPLAGEEHIDRQEAASLAGSAPDICGQDLHDAIAGGTPVEYDLMVQLMDPADEALLPFDPLDDTKVWNEDEYPLTPVGRLSLNRNPDNYMEQIEKVAFSPANLPDGIELSHDKMLQGRSFIYWDAQRHRLGPDFRRIAVNGQPGWVPDAVKSSGLGVFAEGQEMRSDIPKQDDFAQAGERYRSLSPVEQEHLVDNIAVELPLVSRETQNTVLQYLSQASQELGQRVLKQMQQYSGGKG